MKAITFAIALVGATMLVPTVAADTDASSECDGGVYVGPVAFNCREDYCEHMHNGECTDWASRTCRIYYDGQCRHYWP